jgi:hypothetical protein
VLNYIPIPTATEKLREIKRSMRKNFPGNAQVSEIALLSRRKKSGF